MNKLINQHILITRPSPQGEALCELLQVQGASTYHVPTLEIHPKNVKLSFLEPDIAIFISVHAVEYSSSFSFPSSVKYFAVGKATALALVQRGVIPQQSEEGNSEGLLGLPDLQHVQKKEVAIFCGVGGRELLQEILTARGAHCQRYEVYQRYCRMQEKNRLQEILKNIKLTMIVCTSGENLLCLEKLVAEQLSILHQIPLLVISQRLSALAHERGFLRVLSIDGVFDNARIVDNLIRWRKDDVI